jgi:putative transcriptional regulator
MLVVFRLLGALLLAHTVWVPDVSWGGEEPTAPSEILRITRGVFLVASPNLMDPNFQHTVILVCEHDQQQGTLGLIVNRPTEVLLSEALPHVQVLKATSYQVFWGGPVQQQNILMLFRLTEPPPNPREVLTGVYLGGEPDTLNRVIVQPNPTETFRAYAGYAGWAPGQLEYEMSAGSWAVVGGDAASVFDRDPAHLWTDMLDKVRAPRMIQAYEP